MFKKKKKNGYCATMLTSLLRRLQNKQAPVWSTEQLQREPPFPQQAQCAIRSLLPIHSTLLTYTFTTYRHHPLITNQVSSHRRTNCNHTARIPCKPQQAKGPQPSAVTENSATPRGCSYRADGKTDDSDQNTSAHEQGHSPSLQSLLTHT